MTIAHPDQMAREVLTGWFFICDKILTQHQNLLAIILTCV